MCKTIIEDFVNKQRKAEIHFVHSQPGTQFQFTVAPTSPPLRKEFQWISIYNLYQFINFKSNSQLYLLPSEERIYNLQFISVYINLLGCKRLRKIPDETKCWCSGEITNWWQIANPICSFPTERSISPISLVTFYNSATKDCFQHQSSLCAVFTSSYISF